MGVGAFHSWAHYQSPIFINDSERPSMCFVLCQIINYHEHDSSTLAVVDGLWIPPIYIWLFQLLFLSLQSGPGGSSDGLKSSDVDPRLVFHYGFPSGCNKFAYDPLQKILAAATKYVSLITAMWLNCNEALEDEDLFEFTLSLFFFPFFPQGWQN